MDELGPLPEIDLRQVLNLTDGTAILQHAVFATPDLREGYCTDDNARALIAVTLAGHLRSFEEVAAPLQRYLAFVQYAFDRHSGRFRNFLGYDRQWREAVGSEDSHGRAIWGLGVAIRYAPNERVLKTANHLLHDALPAMNGFHNIRPLAFGLAGLHEYLARCGQDGWVADIRQRLADRLYRAWRRNASAEWPWWENALSWGNARLPYALIVSGAALGCRRMLEAGLESLAWLLAAQTAKRGGHLSVIGNRGWYVRGGHRARFDQQPLEAHGLVDACLAAAEATDDRHWLAAARRCFDWFLGQNDLGCSLHDPETGGCRDGLTRTEPNQNQGAESTLAYVLSVLRLHLYAHTHGGTA